MDQKLNIQDFAELLVTQTGKPEKETEEFIKVLCGVIIDALETDKYVKIKGLGTFKLTEVSSRQSIDVNTHERIEIQGHKKVSFTPDAKLKDLINKPFAHFEAVILNDSVTNDEIDNVTDAIPVKKEDDNASMAENTESPSIPIQEHVLDETVQQSESANSKKNESIATKHHREETHSKKNLYILLTFLTLALIAFGFWIFVLKEKTPMPVMEISADVEVPESVSTDSIKIVNENQSLSIPTYNANSQIEVNALPTKVTIESIADTIEYRISGLKANYILSSGESLGKIAKKFYGSKKFWPYIAVYNKDIPNVNRLMPGMVIKVPNLVVR